MALFRVDYSGRGELSERQQKLGRHLSNIIKSAPVPLASAWTLG